MQLLSVAKTSLFRSLLFFLYMLPAVGFVWLVMGPFASDLESKNSRAGLFIAVALVGTLLFVLCRPKTGWLAAMAWTMLVYGGVYKIATFIPDVSSYPWSLGWSEGSRYYFASLFYSSDVYGLRVPPSVLHPTRYLMQSLPFLLPDAPLWLHRLWQVVLWLGVSFWTGIALSRRFKAGWGFVLFSFLFLFQGPVYYHLLVIVLLVSWGVNHRYPIRTLLVVVAASIWAGISRINWFPMPGMLAAVLYLIEVPVGQKSLLRYMLPPTAWVLLGIGIAFLAQYGYIYWSGNPVEQFGSSLTSDLLWYRLWPNATYGPGLLRSVWRISFPVLLILLARWLPNWNRFHPLRILGMFAAITILLLGGIVVSVKIGGGSNLHNLDAFLVILLVVGAGFYYHKAAPEPPDATYPASPLRASGSLWPLVFFVLLFPLRDLTQVGGALPRYNFATAEHEVAVLRNYIQHTARSGGEILFIDQRHLLSTKIISGVPLVADYEVVFLMEMVMGNNQVYLERFHQDLRAGRFASIVIGTPVVHYQDQDFAFPEENNKWVEQVAVPLLCFYKPEVQLPDSGMSILIPRELPCQ